MTKLYWISGRCMMILLCFLASQAWAQSRTVTGKVTGADNGTVLPGVNVIEKGTVNGTATDAEGNFNIQVKDNAVLVISFVGYAPQEITVGNQSSITVALLPDIATLNEVVVIGYGSVKKTDATGALAVIDSKVFNKGVVGSPQELLMGKASGVNITTNGGAPGNASTIRIRGGSSLSASNDPLIVIDGVPISNSNLGGSPNILATINPNDIETFTVLKDASATAIYGLRASNGVIIITTKRGGKGFKINYSATATGYTAPRKVDVYNGNEFRALVNQQYGNNPNALALLGNANTDWQKEIYHKVAVGQDHNLSVTGTALKTPYRVSVGYNNTDGILKTYNFQRTTASIGLDPSLFHDKLKVSINVKGLYNHNNFSDQSAIGDAIRFDPTKQVRDGNTAFRGYYSWVDGNGNANALAPANPVAKLNLTDNTSIVQRSIGNIKLDYALPLVKQLKAALNLGYDYTNTKGHNNVPDGTQWTTTSGGGRFNPYSSKEKNQLLDFYLTYNKEISSSSKLEVVGGYSWSHFYKEGGDSTMNAKGEGKASLVNVYQSEYYLVSLFGRLNYTFKDKYLLTATVRDDATSRFSSKNRFGVFPAIGLAWKIKQEEFLKNVNFISDLKLRASYGVTGQQDITDNDYPYIATYTISDPQAQYMFGNKYYPTLRPDAYNEKIKWETTKTYDIGLDFGFMQNKITASLDVYDRKSYDLISYVPPAAVSNFGSSVISNIGNITNRGIELNISTDIISTDNMRWTVGYNITYNRNEVKKLTLNSDPKFYLPLGNVGNTTAGTIQAQKVGYPRSSFYAYQQVYSADGKPVEDVYVDRNNDGSVNVSDLYIYKKPDPTVYMGINSRLTYKSFDFAFSGRASFGNYVYNNVAASSTYSSIYNVGILSNMSKLADKTKFTTASNTRFSDYYIENAAFFRMDNINMGYTFKNVYADRLNIRIGAGVQNAFVITKYSGIDPEISNGIDNNFFPRTRSFFLNVNCQF